MAPGHVYLVQLWVNDGRNIGESRTETITGGTNTSETLSFGSDGTGPGQYIIGTFVADSTGSQILTVTPYSTGANPNAQINLLQVRDVTPVITSISVHGATLTIHAANGPANGSYVWLRSASPTLPMAQWTPVFTNAFDAQGNINLSTNILNPANPQEYYRLLTE